LKNLNVCVVQSRPAPKSCAIPFQFNIVRLKISDFSRRLSSFVHLSRHGEAVRVPSAGSASMTLRS